MKARMLIWASLLGLMGVVSSYGQRTISTNVPFAFTAGGKSFEGGQYDFFADTNAQTISIKGSGRNTGSAMVITRIAAGMHTTPKDAHVVFDKIGESYILSEVWIPGFDGFVLASTKEQHEHRILDISVK